jgi:FMN phosphatase YigB (HAD superfamily)
MGEQKNEIEELNHKYLKDLKDKVSVYEELVSAVVQLAKRNSKFMENEVELCRLTNNINIIKRQLTQKESKLTEM